MTLLRHPARVACGALLALLLAAAPDLATAAVGDRSRDGVWREVADDAVSAALLVEDFDSPDAYRLLELNDFSLFTALRNAPLEFTPAARTSPAILSLPLPDGGFGTFKVVESPVLSAQLA